MMDPSKRQSAAVVVVPVVVVVKARSGLKSQLIHRKANYRPLANKLPTTAIIQELYTAQYYKPCSKIMFCRSVAGIPFFRR